MPSVQSLISLATLASPAAALESTDQFELTCATDGHEEVDVLQTSLEETSNASTASSDVTGSIFATYSKTNPTMVPTLEFDLDVSGMVTKLMAEGTDLGGSLTSTTPSVYTSPMITWEIYQDHIIGNGNWAFGSQCVVDDPKVIFDEATQTVLPELGTLKIANDGAIYTINYELELPTNLTTGTANTVIASFLQSNPNLPETIVLMATIDAVKTPLFCAKLFSTTGVKNTADGKFKNADGDFVDPSNGAQ